MGQGNRTQRVAHEERPEAVASQDSSVDEMSMHSFPASDPPAVWTWDRQSIVPPGLEPGDEGADGRRKR
jgi:hypothetical protein